MAAPKQPEDPLPDGLARSGCFPDATQAVEVRSTHISWIFLTGPFAYKVKKPVRLDFVDCSTLERRHFFCREELRLNRRLAPDLYLGVVPLYGSRARPSLQPAGDPIEYAVKMRQFDQGQLLPAVVARGALSQAHIDDLIGQASAFHRAVDRAGADTPFGSPELVGRQALDNFPPVLRALATGDERSRALDLRDWTRRELERVRPVLLDRKASGRVRECHGDMHLGNMLLDRDRVVIFDGIDFNEALRWTDVAAEVAFLVMDLQDRGAWPGARRFLNGYLEATGDYGMLRVLPFFLAYRAMVRAKVAAIRGQQDDLEAPEAPFQQGQLRNYLDLAHHYTRDRHPRLLITHGLSGSGKTHGTQGLLEAAGAVRIRSDVERKRLFGLRPLQRSEDQPELDLYTREATQRTYARLAELATGILEAGFPVIVDATFLRRADRATFLQLARQRRVPFHLLHFQAGADTLRRRVRARAQARQDASEADLPVLEQQLRQQEPLTEAELAHAILVDAEDPGAGTGLWARIIAT